MNQQYRYRQFPAGNPLANVLVVIVGVVVISLSLALGFFVFLGIAGFVLVMAAVMGVRNWWFRHRFGSAPGRNGAVPATGPGQPRVIEGEFEKVEDRETTDRQP